ncbi:MAG: helix-turn-helix transcriptional regulator, partial [Micromonosporaceae bacterium]
AFADVRDHASQVSLAAAERILEHVPDDEEIPSRLTAEMIHLAMARRSGDLRAAAAAAARAENLLDKIPDGLHLEHPGAYARVLAGRGAVEFWSGNLDSAAPLLEKAASLLEAEEACAPQRSHELANCRGHLALLEALRERLSQAAEIAAGATIVPRDGRAGHPCPPAAVALALVHLERNELNRVHSQLKLADTSLRDQPDKLVSAIGCLVAARARLAEGHPSAAADMLSRARSGWSPPPWLERILTVTESQVCASAGDIQAAMDAARRAAPERALDATVALARACLAAGDLSAARRALGVAGMRRSDASDRVRVEAWLADARLGFRSGDPARGRRSLERALRLGEPQRLRLPFAMERSWLKPALERHADLAYAHRNVLEPGLVIAGRASAPRPADGQTDPVVVERLSERECEVLRLVGELLSTAEIANEMYISVNTVKTHLKSIFRKLGAVDRRDAVRRARKNGLV